MQRDDYLSTERVNGFIEFLIGELSKSEHPVWMCLKDYNWPTSSTAIPYPNKSDSGIQVAVKFLPDIQCKSSKLEQSTKFLDQCKYGLRSALMAGETDDVLLRHWINAVFHWGGVQHKNSTWAYENENLSIEIKTVWEAIKDLADDSPQLYQQLKFRFNSGLSKVYSLLVDDLIIYDSRVAIGLAKLIREHVDQDEVPEVLKLALPPGQNSAREITGFSRMNSSQTYLKWAIRVSWILSKALEELNRKKKSSIKSRELEAALFMYGAQRRPLTQ